MFLQIEQLLTNQEYELEKTERTSLGGADQAEEALKRHELFASSMISADERIIGIMREAQRLSDNRESAKIQTRADKIDERRQRNHQTAANITADLRVSDDVIDDDVIKFNDAGTSGDAAVLGRL